MSLPYFPLYPADFEADTSHLTMMEDGAYNRLLRMCWMTPGCSLPNDKEWIYRRLRARTDEEKHAVDIVLDEFFSRENDRVENARLSAEALLAENRHTKRVSAGRKGGSKPKSLKTKETNPSNAKAMPKQPEPYKEKDKKEKKPKAETALSELEKTLPTDIAKAVIEHRQKIRKPLTAHAAKLLAGQFSKTGDPVEAANQMIANGWQGFRPEWVQSAKSQTAHDVAMEFIPELN